MRKSSYQAVAALNHAPASCKVCSPALQMHLAGCLKWKGLSLARSLARRSHSWDKSAFLNAPPAPYYSAAQEETTDGNKTLAVINYYGEEYFQPASVFFSAFCSWPFFHFSAELLILRCSYFNGVVSSRSLFFSLLHQRRCHPPHNSRTATTLHFINLKNAWAGINLGESASAGRKLLFFRPRCISR